MPAAVASLNSTNVRNAIRFGWARLAVAVASAVSRERAIEIAARLFTSPPRHAHTSHELEFLATGTRFDVAALGGHLAAWRFGAADRPAVILSHGWGGRGAQLRSFVPALLESGYQVVLFDHAAHGLSGGREATLVHFVKGLEAVATHVEAQGTRVAGIVAHSLGAAAAGAWLNQTRREMRVVLVAPPTSLERYSSYFARRLGIRESIRRAMQEHFERRLGFRWSEFELPQSVAKMRAEALVIHDAADTDVAFASGLALARAWPGARLVRTQGLGHRAILRDAAVVRDAADFIAERVIFAPPPQRAEASAFGAPAPIL
jgi:pimeloyl-ACP methyl ester carboxylesterase